MARLIFITENHRERYLKIITPIGKVLAKVGIHPNVLTVAGLILSILAGLVYSSGHFFWAAWIVVLAGSCDAMDGFLARKTGKSSAFGAFLDSTLDRYSDMFLYAGLAFYYAGAGPKITFGLNKIAREPSPWTVFFIIMAIAGSFMVSYTRARAEAMGIECKVGFMQRTERTVLLIIGSLLGAIPKIGPLFLKTALIILAISTNVTALQRMVYVMKRISRESTNR
jgi:CDP-diacylglycerol--glycerol-3-phosphate 3-phosphatidyltransferase